MTRIGVALFLAGMLAGNAAFAQCRGGGGQGGGATGTGTAGTAAAGTLAATGGTTGATVLTGPGSLAYDVMVAQMISQQMAQRQAILAMHQQKIKQEKLAARRYRAEQTRSQVAASRARTRAALAAQSGLPPAKPGAAALASNLSVRR